MEGKAIPFIKQTTELKGFNLIYLRRKIKKFQNLTEIPTELSNISEKFPKSFATVYTKGENGIDFGTIESS